MNADFARKLLRGRGGFGRGVRQVERVCEEFAHDDAAVGMAVGVHHAAARALAAWRAVGLRAFAQKALGEPAGELERAHAGHAVDEDRVGKPFAHRVKACGGLLEPGVLRQSHLANSFSSCAAIVSGASSALTLTKRFGSRAARSR